MCQVRERGDGPQRQRLGDRSTKDGRNGVFNTQCNGYGTGHFAKGGDRMMRHAMGIDLGFVRRQALQRNGAVSVLGKAVVDVNTQNFGIERVERWLRRVPLFARRARGHATLTSYHRV